jgi:hypothetical protein
MYRVHAAFRKNGFELQSSREFLAKLVGYHLVMFIIHKLFALVWGCGVMEVWWSGECS